MGHSSQLAPVIPIPSLRPPIPVPTMHFDLPFEPIDAFENLENILPPFASKLSQRDLRNFITFGFVSRRFVLHGRFKPVGHVRAMRSEDDFTAESFLNDPVPPGSNEPLYNGDAVGCKCSKSSVRSTTSL
jgi:hypothetical protein